MRLDVTEDDVKLIMKTLERDAKFLSSLGLMDYSLLLGIEKITEGMITETE